jgi:hypothetical protein
MKTCEEGWCIGARILNFGSRRTWMVSFTLRRLYLLRKAPVSIGYWIDVRSHLDDVEQRNISVLAGNRTPNFR